MHPHDAIERLATGGALSTAEAEALFERLLSGGLDDAQAGAVLALLAARPPTVAELVGAARAMRRHVAPIDADAIISDPAARLIDTCGTGGAAKLFNVSTAAAIVAAAVRPAANAAGIQRVFVAKHGNRSRTGRGSAEVLMALGVNTDAPPPVQARCLREAGVCFCFAIHHHPAVRHAMPARRSLRIPTIFNLLGPLTNPARAPRQAIGVYSPHLLPLIANTARELGTTHTIVLHGTGPAGQPLDELTNLGPTTLVHATPQGLRTQRLTTDRLAQLASATGVPLAVAHNPASIPPGLAPESVERAAELLRIAVSPPSAGSIATPNVPDALAAAARGTVLLSAAAAVIAAGVATDFEGALPLAAEAIDSGRAIQTLDTLVRISREPA